MADLQELIEYCSVERPIVVVGAGASCELGLPNWREFADRALEFLRNNSSVDIELAELAFARGDYPVFFSHAARILTPAKLYPECTRMLKDPGGEGTIYRLLTQLPARGFLSTNFDSILKRHFNDRGRAILEHLNTPDGIADVDFQEHSAIVKIHGDFSEPEYLVLTDEQYRSVIHGPQFLHLRRFLSGQIVSRRIVFIGYSISDRDFQLLLEETAEQLRRKVPMYALVPNADLYDQDEKLRRFNLRLVSYAVGKHDHSQLHSYLESLNYHLAAYHGETSETKVPFIAAQSLYLWHKLGSAQGNEATVDALCAMLLGIIASLKQGQTVSQLAGLLSSHVGRNIEASLEGSLRKALEKLTGQALIGEEPGQTYLATPAGIELELRYSRQFRSLQKLFQEQVALDLARRLPTYQRQAIGLLCIKIHDCLVNIFELRGAELTDVAFSENSESHTTLSLMRIVNSHVTDIDDDTRHVLFAYIMGLVIKPSEEQRPYINYLAKAFFAAQAIGVDPEGHAFRQEVLKARTLIVDANVLIPLLAKSSASHPYMYDCVETLKRAGITLITIPKFCEEAEFHFAWAAHHVELYGPQSLQVLSCSTGEGEFRRNEAIDGFIRVHADGEVSMDEYMEECLGGEPNFANVARQCESLGIKLWSLSEIARRTAICCMSGKTSRRLLERSTQTKTR